MVEHNYVTSYVGVIGRRLVVLNWPRQKIRTYLKKNLHQKWVKAWLMWESLTSAKP
jgi:hypothetical protein